MMVVDHGIQLRVELLRHIQQELQHMQMITMTSIVVLSVQSVQHLMRQQMLLHWEYTEHSLSLHNHQMQLQTKVQLRTLQ